MSDLRKAAEMALESWGFFFSQAHPEIVGLMYGNDWAKIAKERTEALRQALAMEKFSEVNQEIEEALKQPKWVGLEDEDVATVKNEFNRGALWAEQILKEKNKREWVGLTDEEGAEIWGDAHDLDWKRTVTPKEIIKRIEAKLKEKNT